ncbi:MAG: polyribonucleotide nucleotidyltransferase [Phycisphaerae bacterium]|nr:polyribonucleotide nucleotidyltransferase [Phycisphaerae bacterium]
MTYRVEKEIGGKLLSIESGKMARQAHGAATVRYGDTVVLATVVTGKPREGIDFFPLQVDYREKMYAAGKFPGGFFKREGRPTTKEILTMRLIDRPIRPLFPDGYMDEVVIQCMVLSSDQENDPDILAMIGASACLCVSKIPFEGPTAAVRVGRVDGEYIINPTVLQRNESDLEIVLAGHRDAVNMIEVGARELPEDVITGGIAAGFEVIREVCDLINELAEKVGTKKEWTPPEPLTELREKVASMAEAKLRAAKRTTAKQARNEAVEAVYTEVMDTISPKDAVKPQYTRGQVYAELQRLEERVVRETILNDGIRPDGRGTDDIRPIKCEVGVLPRTHGSALFSRGETQALVVVTLGTSRDEQLVDDLLEEYSKKFMLHYNFPPFSVGEVRRIMGPSRREIGHGALAERALEAVLPSPEKFPYTIRVVSDIMESNGSSSMASVCGGTLSLMDAGVPIAHPVAGISIGMVSDGKREVLLTDILGEEDHFGDMDFKVSGSQVGVTAVQLDLKTRGLRHELICQAMEKAKTARRAILREMLGALREPRPNISAYAPRLLTVKINPEKIGKVIGPAGKGIKGLEASTGATIDISDDGTVYISCLSAEGAEAARAAIEAIAEEVKIGRIYTGRVTSIKEFGAFVEVVPGQDGLCHISELSNDYVQRVGDVCKVGDMMKVKVIAVDEQGRIKLSRKQAMREEATASA